MGLETCMQAANQSVWAGRPCCAALRSAKAARAERHAHQDSKRAKFREELERREAAAGKARSEEQAARARLAQVCWAVLRPGAAVRARALPLLPPQPGDLTLCRVQV